MDPVGLHSDPLNFVVVTRWVSGVGSDAMARRARSSFSTSHLVFAVILLAVFIGGAFLLLSRQDDSFRTLPDLEPSAYLENANSLRGNTYKLSATIDHSLAWSSVTGRLFSVRVNNGRETILLPMLIPPTLNDINVQRGQNFLFKIEVVDKGLIRVLEMRKS